MRADDPRNLADLPGPRNLQQEIETVDDVGFDLGALIRAEAPLRDGEIANFLRCKHGPLDSARVLVGLPGDFKQAVKFSLGKHGWLVGLEDGLKSAFHLNPAEAIFLLEGSDARQGLRPVQFHQELDLFALHAGFQFLVEIVEAVGDEINLKGIELLGLDQNILTNAYFSEIVQQSGVTDLLHLLGSEPDRRIRSVIHAIHNLRKADGHLRNAQRMARSCRIALLNRLDGSLDESFEQFFYVLIEAAIFVGDGGLRGQRESQPDRAVRERPHFAGNDFPAREARFGMQLAINELQYADDLAATVLHGKRHHGARKVSGLLVEVRVETIGTVARDPA